MCKCLTSEVSTSACGQVCSVKLQCHEAEGRLPLGSRALQLGP